MTTGSIFLGFALFVLVLIFLIQPLFMANREQPLRLGRREALLLQKDALLEEIRQLDFEHETGKVPDDVHAAQRAYLVAAAADALAALDALPEAAASATTALPDDMAAQIEAAVARLRRQTPPAAANSRAGFCTQCGAPLDAHDKFCAGCGHPVAATSPIAPAA